MAAESSAEVLNFATPQPPMPTDTLSVDPTAAEALLSAQQLGQRIKRLRLKRSMGLVELGRQTGLSASFLSQLETGRVVPTLRNLARIALVFNKDLSYFFESAGQSVFRIQRRRDRVRLPVGSPDPDYIAESFGILVPEGGLRPCLAEFLAGDERSAFHPDRYTGVEMVYVLNGSIELRRKGEPAHPRPARRLLHLRRNPAHLPLPRRRTRPRPHHLASTASANPAAPAPPQSANGRLTDGRCPRRKPCSCLSRLWPNRLFRPQSQSVRYCHAIADGSCVCSSPDSGRANPASTPSRPPGERFTAARFHRIRPPLPRGPCPASGSYSRSCKPDVYL